MVNYSTILHKQSNSSSTILGRIQEDLKLTSPGMSYNNQRHTGRGQGYSLQETVAKQCLFKDPHPKIHVRCMWPSEPARLKYQNYEVILSEVSLMRLQEQFIHY